MYELNGGDTMENANKLASRQDVETKDSLIESYAKYMLSEDKDKFIEDSTEVQKTAVKVANTTLIHIPGLSFLYDKWADLQKKIILMIRKDARNYLKEKDEEKVPRRKGEEYRNSMKKENFVSSAGDIPMDMTRDNSRNNERVSEGFSKQ